jgi:hypothetical protein
LRIYREEKSTERGFRFIKDPLFFAHSLFVKSPERVETMMMLMALGLLVYNLGERQLRISLKTQKATVKNQLNKPTESPTLHWIFQSQCLGLVPRLVREAPRKEAATGVCFQGIHFLITEGVHRIMNLTEKLCRIFQFLPTACQKYYLFSEFSNL